MGSDGPHHRSAGQHDRLSALQERPAPRALQKLGSEPAWIAYETKDGKRYEKAATPDDIERALSHRRDAIDAWYPTVSLNADREMYIRCALQLQGIDDGRRLLYAA